MNWTANGCTVTHYGKGDKRQKNGSEAGKCKRIGGDTKPRDRTMEVEGGDGGGKMEKRKREERGIKQSRC